MPEEDRPDAVVFAILTDGLENASTRFSLPDVKARIAHQSEKYSWDFRFLAANQDAVLTGHGMGLNAASCRTIHADGKGVRMGMAAVACECCGDVRERARRVRSSRRHQG